MKFNIDSKRINSIMSPRIPMKIIKMIMFTLVISLTITANAAEQIEFEAAIDHAENPTTDFEIQLLNPTQAKISRPKGWFYTEKHSPLYTWTLSREPHSANPYKPYTTGVHISMVRGFNNYPIKSAKEYVLKSIDSNKALANKIIYFSPEINSGVLTRISLETEQGRHHVLKTYYWSNVLDVVVTWSASTSKELWISYVPIFEKMSEFEVLDLMHFKNK